MKYIKLIAILLLVGLTTQAQLVSEVSTTTTVTKAVAKVDYVVPSQIAGLVDSIKVAKMISDALANLQSSKTLSVSYPLVLDTTTSKTNANIYLSTNTQTITLGGVAQITQGVNRVVINPSVVQVALTLNLPTTFADNQNLTILAGTTISVGTGVISTFALKPAAGQTLSWGSSAPVVSLKSGDIIILNYDAVKNSFTKIN